jgi:hypothetical protein
MRDFLGREFQVGDFCVSAGGGNRVAEYGMILFRVKQIDPSLRMQRLVVDYNLAGSRRPQIRSRSGTMINGNKYLILSEPSDQVVLLFEFACDGRLSDKGQHLVAKWLHGIDDFVFPADLQLGPLLTDSPTDDEGLT